MTTVNELMRSLSGAPDGLSVAELLSRHPTLARRTLQRRLAALIDEGRVAGEGRGRARRYRPSIRGSAALPVPQPKVTGTTNLVSPDSHDILEHLARPLVERDPVGYRRSFLDAYLPGRSWYLPEPLRRQLHRMGETGETARPAGTYGRAVLDRLLIDLSWASSHLEGNTYDRLDTGELIEHGRVARGKNAAETQMILNHKAAIELLVENAESVGFDRYTLTNLHAALAENLLPNPADEGRLRRHPVEITGSVYRPPDVPTMIEELLDLVLEKAGAIPDPFEQAFFVMVHLPYLQPFADVNERSSRLLANLPLIRANLCPLTFVGVAEDLYVKGTLGVYELTRVELLRDVFCHAYERSTREYLAVRRRLVEPDPLRLRYRDLIRRVVREVVVRPEREPLEAIRERLADAVDADDRGGVEALLVDELRRLHPGTLARYGLRPSELERWRAMRGEGAGDRAREDR